MNKFPFASTIIPLMIFIISCSQSNTADLPVTMDDSSRIIIDRAISYAGNYNVWQQKKTLSFDKKSMSYDSTGKVVREVDMHLDYMIKPEFRAKLTYKLHDTSITLLHDGQKARKLYNGKVSNEQNDIDGAWNSCFGSQFVTCMPFKLNDPGIKAEYVGNVTMKDGEPAQVVKTSYIKGAGSNPDHKWYYYFEPGTGKLLANSLNTKNNYWDYTRYESFEKAGGLLMPSIRKSYDAGALNKPGRMVSESRHSNIVFDKELAADYFKIPN
ncbi:MAG: DUF6503 family protein [Segetibacter sp.]